MKAAELDGRCVRWAPHDALLNYARHEDVTLNRDAHGSSLIFALTRGVWLMERHRWQEADRAMIGMENRELASFFGPEAERVAGVIRVVRDALKECRMMLGPDYSIFTFHLIHPKPT